MMLHCDPAKPSMTGHIRKIINKYFTKMEKTYHCEANIYKCEEMKLKNIKINTIVPKINQAFMFILQLWFPIESQM